MYFLQFATQKILVKYWQKSFCDSTRVLKKVISHPIYMAWFNHQKNPLTIIRFFSPSTCWTATLAGVVGLSAASLPSKISTSTTATSPSSMSSPSSISNLSAPPLILASSSFPVILLQPKAVLTSLRVGNRRRVQRLTRLKPLSVLSTTDLKLHSSVQKPPLAKYEMQWVCASSPAGLGHHLLARTVSDWELVRSSDNFPNCSADNNGSGRSSQSL